MAYSSREYWEMIVLYGECGRDAAATAREYAIRFPHRRHPDTHVILRLNNRTVETGVLKPERRGLVPFAVRGPATEERVLAAVGEDDTRSIRTIARMTGTSYTTTQRILKSNDLHAFHHTKVHDLQIGDPARRLEFCQWLLNRHREDPDFVHQILFTDESNFSRDGYFNSHNSHIWAVENPRSTKIVSHQIRFSLNLWTGIYNGVLMGPRVIPARLNGEFYTNFLGEDLPEMLENIPLAARQVMWFQHDGAPPHSTVGARAILDRNFRNSWIGRHGPVAWPPRSPDLTPLDFFFWSYVKDYVYKVPVENLATLQARIWEAVATVTPEVLRNAQAAVIRRAELCVQQQGGHFEHLL